MVAYSERRWRSAAGIEGGKMVAPEVATVFVHTNLDTRICFSVPNTCDITVGELKKYFEEVHFSCLPDIGQIKVTSILVEAKPYFYRMANSTVVNTAFPEIGEPWVLRVEATPLLSKHHHDENKTSCSTKEKRSECDHQSEQHEATIDDAVKEKGNSHKTSTQCEQHEDAIDDAVKEKGNSQKTSTSYEHQLEQHENTIDDVVKEKGNCLESSMQNATTSSKSECLMRERSECEHQSEQHEATIDDAVREKGISHKTSTQCEQHEDITDDAVKEKGNCLESSMQNAAICSKSECLMLESKVENVVESHANSVQGSQSKMSTQVISVTGLINKYFSGFNGITSSSDSDVTSRVVCSSEIEVQSTNRKQSCCSKTKIDALPHSTPKPSKRRMKALPQLTPKTPLHMLSKTSGSKNPRYIVGERLLSASKSFRGCMTERSPSLSVCKFNNDRDKSQTNGSIFSISDSDH